jgi:hypothetical protein
MDRRRSPEPIAGGSAGLQGAAKRRRTSDEARRGGSSSSSGEKHPAMGSHQHAASDVQPAAAATVSAAAGSSVDPESARELRLQCVRQRRSVRRSAAAGCDIEAYREMASDKLRMRSYRNAIVGAVRGQRVLELGPGPLCPLTLMCLQAGAKEVVTVESCGWAATAARELLESHTCATVIEGDAATLRPDDLPTAGGSVAKAHFDVMIQELYGTVAGAEDVVEILAALRSNGFTFGRVISRGFEVLAAPCSRPSLAAVPPPLLPLCGNPGGEPELAATLRTHNWLVHGTWHGAHLRIAQPAAALELAPPQVWQRVDLETSMAAGASDAPTSRGWPRRVLQWKLRGDQEVAGFLFSSRFFFKDSADTLDARRQPTHWGSLFVPWDFVCGEDPVAVELRTSMKDATRPACFDLFASVGEVAAEGPYGVPQRCAAACRTGDLASEHFA